MEVTPYPRKQKVQLASVYSIGSDDNIYYLSSPRFEQSLKQ